MKHKFTIARDGGKWARGIKYGRRWVLSLHEGTQINADNVDWIINRLNGSEAEPKAKR